jgi:hypothetical protein
VIDLAAKQREAKLVLIDVGPNLGLVNCAALIAAEQVVIPLAPDLYSLQGLRNLGLALRRWRGEWNGLRARNPVVQLSMPPGHMKVAGYVVLRPPQRLDQPAKLQRSRAQILYAFREATVEPLPDTIPESFEEDPECLGVLMHYRSLFPLAQEARKPMFFLKPADGLTGGHAPAVQQCYRDFRGLAQRIAGRCGLAI